ncbi:hypothetical protein [Actinomadura sp. DC4]|uniref:hypothetical protein n=1 Tax=Actinomadura sp. DC4 TaxID=3055069 RepID=UPI0025B1DE04|nr:hypothetical protein [Actinomadura sp. DC4]MDN3359939.1 hypothetical protein [Actinomadura sp. DC4]
MSVGRKVVAGVLTAGLMALAMWLYTFKPHIEAGEQNPITSSGRLGSVVDNRVFSVKVDRVDVARSLTKASSFSGPEVTPSIGLFLIVHANIKSNHKPFQPGHVRLVTGGGLSYDESGRAALPSTTDDYQPMLWAPATYIFELPRDRLAGARLIIGESAFLNQLSAETSIDLGMSGDRAAQLSTHPATTYTLKTP